MVNDRKTLLAGLISIVWLLIAFIAYASTHKPFTPEIFLGLLTQLWAVITAIIIASLAGGIGGLFKLKRFQLSPLILAATEAGLGLGILSIAILFLGTTIGVNFYLVLIVTVSAALLRKNIWAWWRSWHSITTFWANAGNLGKWIAALVGLLIVCAFATALSPTIQFDALTYHLALPKIFIQQGRISFVPDIMFWGMAQLVEMIYMLAMLVAGASAAHMLGLLIGLMALIAVLAFTAEKTGSIDAGWVAVASLLCGFTLVWLLSAAYTEWFVIFYGALAFVWLAYWVDTKASSALFILGLIAGMALSVKYTAGLVLLTSVLIVFFHGFRHGSKQSITWLLILGGCSILIYAPWMLKNFIATGNPFYPIVFPTPEVDAIRLVFYQFKPGGQDWSRLLFIPWQATLLGAEGKEGYSASIGALLLSLSPLAGLGWRQKSETQKNSLSVATMLVIISFLIWAIGSQFRGLLIQTRLFLSLFPAWAMLSAFGFANISEIKAFNIRFGNLARTFVVLALAFNVYDVLRDTTATGGFDIAMQTTREDDYIQRNMGAYKTAMDEINALPSGSRVLMLWETRGYYCLPLCDPDEVIDRWYHDWTLAGTPEGVLSDWKSEGITHVLLYHAGEEFIRKNDKVAPYTSVYWDGLDKTLSQLQEVRRIDNEYLLYILSK